MANRFKKMIQPLLDEARKEGYKAGHEQGLKDGFLKKTLAYENEIKFLKVLVERLRGHEKPKPRPRPKGWQPMGARTLIEYCPTCKNEGSDLCGMCAMEIRSGYEPKENFPKVVVSPFEDASNNKEMYFKCGTRHMKAMVLAMLQDVLDQAGGFCIIDVSEVIKAVEDI